jgi:peptidoglycan hydrolase-like protein with peptidoglycan-binding domain
MRLVYLPIVLVSFLLVGCATTRQPSEVSQLQIKVSQLERKLDDKDQEINDLKSELSELSSRQDNNASSDSEDVSTTSKVISSKGSSGEDIIRVSASPKEVQRALKKAGYYDGSIDGKIGSGSQKAIASFQKDHNLGSDGIVGQKTWNELKKYLE